MTKWGNTQFYHSHKNFDHKKRFTVAVNVPSSKEFLELIKQHKPVILELGISYVHDNDNYVKSIGRQISSNRIKKHNFYIEKKFDYEKEIYVSLKNEYEGLRLDFRIPSEPNKKAYFVYADLL